MGAVRPRPPPLSAPSEFRATSCRRSRDSTKPVKRCGAFPWRTSVFGTSIKEPRHHAARPPRTAHQTVREGEAAGAGAAAAQAEAAAEAAVGVAVEAAAAVEAVAAAAEILATLPPTIRYRTTATTSSPITAFLRSRIRCSASEYPWAGHHSPSITGATVLPVTEMPLTSPFHSQARPLRGLYKAYHWRWTSPESNSSSRSARPPINSTRTSGTERMGTDARSKDDKQSQSDLATSTTLSPWRPPTSPTLPLTTKNSDIIHISVLQHRCRATVDRSPSFTSGTEASANGTRARTDSGLGR